jgi:hypothetical protein
MRENRSILYFGVLVSVFVLVSCGTQTDQAIVAQEEVVEENMEPNQLTQAEIDDGWILLFDGETSNGWTGYKDIRRSPSRPVG